MRYLKSAKLGYVFAILSAGFFGSVSTVAKPTLANINPLLLTCLVYLISAAAITPATLHKRSSFVRKDFFLIVAVAIIGAVIAPAMYFFGLHLTLASNAAVLSNTEIVFTVLIAIFFFHERLNRIGYFGLFLVAAGAVIITTNLQFSKSVFDLDVGDFLIIGSSAFWALDNNISKIITQRVDVLKIAQLKSVIGGIILLVVVLSSQISINLSSSELSFVLLLGVVGFAASLYCFLKAMSLIGMVKTIVIFTTSSVFGLVFAMFFLHEKISVYQVVAITIMMIGIYIINKKGQIEPTITPP